MVLPRGPDFLRFRGASRFWGLSEQLMRRFTTLALGLAATAAMPLLGGCNQAGGIPAEQVEAAPTPEIEGPEVEPNGRVIDIYMYTVDPENSSRMHVFKPNLVSAKVGDTIRFIPTEPSHQSSSIATMLPDGAKGWEGEVNEEIRYVLPKPGVYGYQCIPHYAAGMVGVVIVEGEGKTANLPFALEARHPGLGNPKFVEIFAEARARGMFDPAPTAPDEAEIRQP
jgi:pseudoazurin